MSTIDQLKSAIEALSKNEYVALRQWFLEKDWQKWDEQIEEDSRSGKLDLLLKEAFSQKKRGKLRNL